VYDSCEQGLQIAASDHREQVAIAAESQLVTATMTATHWSAIDSTQTGADNLRVRHTEANAYTRLARPYGLEVSASASGI
jgi:hypothetical protein